MSATEELPTFDLTQKKKKKSSSSKDGEEKKKSSKSKSTTTVVEEVEVISEEKEKKKKKKSSSSSDAPTNAEGEEDSGNVLDFGKKKKKKSSSSSSSSSSSTTTTDAVEGGEGETTESTSPSTSTSNSTSTTSTATVGEDFTEVIQGTPWVGTDRDYKYAELTYRIYHLLQANNPELISDQKRAMRTPKVFKEGSRKTVWANFAEICQILGRKTDHVLSYIFAELGTNGSVDGNQNLVIKGRFQQQQIEVVIRHYISEYVACRNCKSPNTTLEKTNRLYFLCCNVCNSKRSVAVIKKGVEGVGKKAPKENN